jgi:transcriptional regulator with GAF, ATPase, and Fis domain
LIESELFGHVKEHLRQRKDRAGKFEAADKGTIFLDEMEI